MAFIETYNVLYIIQGFKHDQDFCGAFEQDHHPRRQADRLHQGHQDHHREQGERPYRPAG
jgi:hypothetical protein